MSVVHGKNTVLEVFSVDTWYPVLCGTDLSFTSTMEMVESTGPNSVLFRERKARLQDWNASVSGLTTLENGTSVSFFYMLQQSVRRTLQQIRLSFQDDEGSYKRITGNALIETMGISGPYSDFSNATISFLGSGAYEIDAISAPSTPIEYADYWTTVAGNSYINGTSAVHTYDLTGKTVLLVFRSGVEHTLVTTTPSGRQCKFTSGTGRIDFDTSIPFESGETVTVNFTS